MNREAHTQKLLDSFRGKPGEFYMLKGVLCLSHHVPMNQRHSDPLVTALSECLDSIAIARRMDELNRLAA